MAFLARLGALTDELVSVITGISPDSDPERFNVYRESSLRNLRHHTFLRTDQFDVQNQLNGLEERFAVQGREGLATALRERLEALEPHNTKWTPDILHLLLELSDKPTQKSRLSDLDQLHEPETDIGPTLKWEDIAREDGWHQDRALWKNVDFHDSSDDDYGAYEDDGSSSISVSSGNSTKTSIEIPSFAAVRTLTLLPPDPTSLAEVQASQSWRIAELPRDADGHLSKIAISERQMVREVLFMLSGLSTTLFDKECAPVPSYQLSDVLWDTYRALINSFAEVGRTLLPLRVFIATQQQVPLLQVFQDSIRQRIGIFDRHVMMVQKRFIAITEDVVVSLGSILEEVKAFLPPLLVLSDIIRQLDEEGDGHPFRYLELLFDVVGAGQLEGRDFVARDMASMFLECFQVYLRPIRLWMEDGQLLRDDRTFFVSESAARTPLNRIWQDQFKLRRTPDGTLHAPRFLHPAVSRIFTTGKSVVVLKQLGRYQAARAQWAQEEPHLDVDTVWPTGMDLAPFAELFGRCFDLWIRSKHHNASQTLRGLLFDSCGLWSTLNALEHIYLTSDGAISDAFASAVFRNLDTMNPHWCDRFTLTEQAQEALSFRVDESRIIASTSPDIPKSDGDPSVARKSVRSGPAAVRITYRMAWPVQLVIGQESIARYQMVFTLLFQLRCAVLLLKKYRILDDSALGMSDSAEILTYYSARNDLLWFCRTFHTYLANLVLAPASAEMQRQMRDAEDVDTMISIHSSFIKALIDEACLGKKLEPIRGCVLDILDLSIALEDARRSEAVKQGQDVSRLSIMGSPPELSGDRHQPNRRGLYVNSAEEEEIEASMMAGIGEAEAVVYTETPYLEVLREVRSDFSRHMRFLTHGLRGVARASTEAAAGKWDILAEMLEVGIREPR